MPKNMKIGNGQHFALSAIAAVNADIFCNPFNVCKVRMQLGINPGHAGTVFYNIVRKEGFLGLYSGIYFSLMRQLVYGQLRIGGFAVAHGYLEDEILGIKS